ncbi:hypothetical protein Lesp02_70300 [Lentzea sp. NBRC 105346]|uniref:hypothetical protein n=1 Tax=Lentzea sp. NBRC 105346 TaxID=3032205 RepID=UPI0024A5BB74|nr:hypothetical protein [Lentzea sp. NBRC 105346]GLZ34843.1 hypothetical protein Lesp02_70300 [Lentzea sp. NBRC 105346]
MKRKDAPPDDWVDEEIVDRAIGRALNWTIREAERFQVPRPLTPAERRAVAERLAARGLGAHYLMRACRITGTNAKQLLQEVTAA